MAENRRFYYLKLKENFYNSETMVVLESMPDGLLYSNLLLKMYLMSLKSGGILMLNEHLPHTVQTIATFTRHQIGTVERAIKVFMEFGLVEVLTDGAFYMADIQLLIGQSSTEGERKKRERSRLQRQKLLPSGKVDICPPIDPVDKCPPILEMKLSQQYEAEQEQLESELKRLAAEMETMQEQTGRVDKFMALVDRYTSFDELTTPMLNEFVEKVVVHERVSVGRYKRKQRVDVYFNFIGLVELPTEPEDEAPAAAEPPQERYVAVNTSFAPLGEYLSQQTENSVTLSFADVERVIGKPLCKSAFKFYSYWYPGGNRPISNVIYNAGFDVDRVDLKNQLLYLIRAA